MNAYGEMSVYRFRSSSKCESVFVHGFHSRYMPLIVDGLQSHSYTKLSIAYSKNRRVIPLCHTLFLYYTFFSLQIALVLCMKHSMNILATMPYSQYENGFDVTTFDKLPIWGITSARLYPNKFHSINGPNWVWIESWCEPGNVCVILCSCVFDFCACSLRTNILFEHNPIHEQRQKSQNSPKRFHEPTYIFQSADVYG